MEEAKLTKLLELFDLQRYILVEGIPNKTFKIVDVIDWQDNYQIVVEDILTMEQYQISMDDVVDLETKNEKLIDLLYDKG